MVEIRGDTSTVSTFWNVKCVVRLFMLQKPKLSFDIGSLTIKTNIALSGKETENYPQKLFHNCYCLDLHLRVDDWDFTLFEQCEIHKQLKVRNFWQNRLKTFYPSGLHEKKDYLPLAYPIYEIQTIYYKGNYIYADIYR